MRNMIIIYILLFNFIYSLCYAQQNSDERIKQNIVSINSGYNQFKDENLHPKVFRGLSIGASYSNVNIRKNISEYSIGLNISLLNTVYEEFPSALSIMINGNYKYLFPVVTSGKWVYYIGPFAGLQYGTNAYFNWDESHFYFANYISGGIGNRINYSMGNGNLDFNLDFPLISGISRPKPNRQYKIDDMTFAGIMKNLADNPQCALPDKNFYLKTELEFLYSSKRLKTRSIGYNLQYHYMQARNGELYQNISHAISYKYIY